MPLFKKLVVKEIKKEAKNAISILFNVPLDLKPHYNFIAGQYLNLRLILDGKEIRRAYSICSSPESGELRIAIKAVKNGLFSLFANSKLKEGNIIEVGKPEGKFIFEPQIEKQKNYLAFVAGSGITPTISILKSMLKSEPKSTFVLVYGNKSIEETIFYQELHQLQLEFVGRLFVHFIFSQTKVDGCLFGRIDKSIVNYILNTKYLSIEFDKFFLCGPEKMIDTCKTVLKENNILEKQIKFELFSTSTSEDEAKNNIDGHSKITIIVEDNETSFEMSKKQTILEAALKQGIDVPYSCQGGICSSCLARVKEGTVHMKKNAILTDKEIEEGLILTCQAQPNSASIIIDYDSV